MIKGARTSSVITILQSVVLTKASASSATKTESERERAPSNNPSETNTGRAFLALGVSEPGGVVFLSVSA